MCTLTVKILCTVRAHLPCNIWGRMTYKNPNIGRSWPLWELRIFPIRKIAYTYSISIWSIFPSHTQQIAQVSCPIICFCSTTFLFVPSSNYTHPQLRQYDAKNGFWHDIGAVIRQRIPPNGCSHRSIGCKKEYARKPV